MKESKFEFNYNVFESIDELPEEQIADFTSECLVLGIYDENKDVVLIQPQHPVSNGLKIG